MKKTLKIILYPLSLVCLGFVWIYKIFISPFFPSVCRFRPTCSTYALQSIRRFGPFSGTILAIKRIHRCNGKNGGYDPVPANLKGEQKWLF